MGLSAFVKKFTIPELTEGGAKKKRIHEQEALSELHAGAFSCGQPKQQPNATGLVPQRRSIKEKKMHRVAQYGLLQRRVRKDRVAARSGESRSERRHISSKECQCDWGKGGGVEDEAASLTLRDPSPSFTKQKKTRQPRRERKGENRSLPSE